MSDCYGNYSEIVAQYSTCVENEIRIKSLFVNQTEKESLGEPTQKARIILKRVFEKCVCVSVFVWWMLE